MILIGGEFFVSSEDLHPKNPLCLRVVKISISLILLSSLKVTSLLNSPKNPFPRLG